MSTGWLFAIFLEASALSVGGQSAVPLLRNNLVGPGLLTNGQVVQALAIGRLSPGPSGFYILALGYFAMGWVGAMLALAACVLPPLVVFPAERLVRSRRSNASVAGAVRGLGLTATGLGLATSLGLLKGISTPAAAWWQLPLAAIAAVIGFRGRHHPVVILGVGAAVGLALG